MSSATPFRIFAAVTAVVAAGALVAIQVTRSDGPRARAGPAGPGPVTPPTPTVSPSPTDRQPTAVPAPPPPGRVIFEDDFSTPDGGLLGGASSDSGETLYGDRFAEYTGGRLLVRATSDRRDFVGGANTGAVVLEGRALDDLADVSVEVRATPVDIGPGAGWGITCRRDFGVGSFYLGLVTLEGDRRRAAIVRQDVAGEGWTELASTRLPSSILLEVGAPNLLRFDCVGSAISFSLGGKLVLEARDGALTSGAVTLGANPLPAGGETAVAEVEFDDFVLREVT